MTDDPFAPDSWCGRGFAAHRALLGAEIASSLADIEAVREVTIESGPSGREYDLVVALEMDVGRMRTPLWSHARATIFCDLSIHEANRMQVSPASAVAEAVGRLRPRLAVPFNLESRGLTLDLRLEEGVQRSWTAEHSRFRKRTAVIREDRVEHAADVDVRDLLAHFYSGPSMRLVGEDGQAFLLPAAVEVEGPLVTLCAACDHWSRGSHERCPHCASDAVDPVVAARPPRR